MLMPVSADFIALCRWQLSLLAQGFNAEQSTLYLAEDWQEAGSTALRPVLRYPDRGDSSPGEPWQVLALEPSLGDGHFTQLAQGVPLSLQPEVKQLASLPQWQPMGTPDSHNQVTPSQPATSCQIVVPLIHEKLVLGLLTVERLAPDWNAWEQSQVEKVVHTLAISCFLDQQNQWFLQQQTSTPELALIHPGFAHQRERVDNLLHQLKSPVTAIRTFGKLILKRLKPQDENRRAVDGILQETDHVQDLLREVQQVLEGAESVSSPTMLSGVPELSMVPDCAPNLASLPPSVAAEMNPGQVAQLQALNPTRLLMPANFCPPLALASCQIAEVLSLPLTTATAIAQERNVELQVEIETPLPPVIADAKALREVVTNIVDNALKYTPAGGRISILVFCDRKGKFAPASPQTGIAIAVSDTGYGIPPADQARLFERNYRGEKAQGSIPGTGLGLAIARELMIKMQGNVCYWSPRRPELGVPGFDDSQSDGSTFLIWIPTASTPKSTQSRE